MLEATGDIGDTVKPLATAAKGEAEKLGHQVTAMANLFPSLAGAAIGAASKTTSSQMQTSLLEQTKTLTGGWREGGSRGRGGVTSFLLCVLDVYM